MRKIRPELLVGLLAAIGLWAWSRTNRGEVLITDAIDYGVDAVSSAVDSTRSFLERVLPGAPVHLTGIFDEMRGDTPHLAVDFNYVGGQTGLNLTHPPVHAPISGVVTFSGGLYGTVKIQDDRGFSHELLHLQDRYVSVGDTVSAGDAVGTMGGRGPLGANQYAQHIHYQLRAPDGVFIDPVAFWANTFV